MMYLKPSTAVYVVYANIALYCLCYMMQQPVLPYRTKQLGASNAEFAQFQSLFNLVQSVGGLLSGPVMDALGGRMLLLISFMASALCYSMTASATSLLMLYLSRVPTLLQHAVLAARTIVTSASAASDRAKHLGYVGVCTGIGMTAGPMIGGYLSEVSLEFVSWIATAGSFFSLLTVLLLVPPPDAPSKKGSSSNSDYNVPKDEKRESSHNINGTAASSESSNKSVTSDKNGKSSANIVSGGDGSRTRRVLILGHFWEVLVSPGVSSLMTLKIITTLASTLFQSMFTVVLQNQGQGPKYAGNAMSFLGMTSILSQAFLVAPAIQHLGESRTIYIGCWGLLGGFILLALAKGATMTVVSLIPQSLAGVLISAVSTSKLTKAVSKERLGTALAIDMGVWSAVRMVTPSMGAWLLEHGGSSGIGSLSAALMVVLLGSMHLGMVDC
ncbi:hypothetical protein CEUSTIGMA_g11614.t1 [Chlamydomonas eustigma]|uniref:Major facilitator superfamily (MFS) profile domain-containing protein n=1 Tax=Chlamydomonas eustigma TaxID=1157962 RepID=A0A250XM61_9CHLO|nr:hypothetical protein CEUSTIGMA_g11614.t1 [Chlamydomonas eustigma]|eukprot:GAX84191.1 hypothetical protein CEUSTIGMA_g11614.t1 [Chlamydomonas eustigma]